MLNYSDDELLEITRLAGLFFTPAEIALMLELDSTFYIDVTVIGSNSYKAFNGGRLQGEVDLRTGIMKMAKAGSSPAQTMALEMLKASKIKLMDDGA